MKQGNLINGYLKKRMFEHKKMLSILLCLIVLVLGGWYFYCMQLAYAPNWEDMCTIWRPYKLLRFGVKYYSWDIMYEFVACISTLIGGMSYFSVRLHFTIMQVIVLSCTMYLSLKQNEKKDINLFLIPLFSWFAIFLHPVTIEEPYGIEWDYGTDFWYQWPYIYHISARVYALLCIITINMMLNAKSCHKKRIFIGLGVIFTFLGLILKDLIFVVLFVAPLGIVFFFDMVHNEKYRKYIIYTICLCAFGLLATKFLPSNIENVLWTTQKASTYGRIYGATNWTTLDMVGTALINYINKILDYFYISLDGAPVISFYTLVYGIKLMLLIIGYIIVFSIIKDNIVGCKDRYNIVDEILAWSFVVLSIVLAVTEYGYYDSYTQRYGVALVTIMTILICRHIESFLVETVKLVRITEWKEKTALAVIVGILCLCTMKPAWTYSAHNCHDEDMESVLNYIESENLGYAVASRYLATPMTAKANGKVIICSTIDEVKQIFGEDAKVTYMITRYDYELGQHHQYLYYEPDEPFNNYEELCAKYSVPSKVIDYDSFSLCIWENGIEMLE